ncbi:hypothetical protein BROOK1789B_1189 [Bathymodiolus brooksi thiotrophic gill symbiont]|nr:hypothetical protein BROOK1789B_1189 [Bathymodiolus brooksi thiotrophic gill symbiont]
MMYLTYRPLPNRSRTIFKLTSCKDIPVSASDFVPSRLLIDQLCLKMAIIGSDAPEFYKLVSIILIYLKMPVYVGNVI